MQALDTLQIQDERGDLSGTRITASKPVGVFSGNIRVHVTYDGISTTGSRDHLVEQVPPISSYGFHFAMMTTPDRSVGDDYKFVASEPDTRECSLTIINVGYWCGRTAECDRFLQREYFLGLNGWFVVKKLSPCLVCNLHAGCGQTCTRLFRISTQFDSIQLI